MLPSLSRGLRLALMTTLMAGYLVGHPLTTYAQDDEDEGEGDDGGDAGDKGVDDGEDAGDVEDDKDQPAMTAGGLYTLKSFPVRELFRPLTITQQITQVRAGIGTDVSNKGAFESVGVNLEALHGYRDNFMLLGGFTSAYNFQQFNAYAGFEGALAYDLLDFRLAARIGRTATDVDPDVNEVDYKGGGVKFSLDIGFPFRYVARPEIAIIALNTLMSIDFNASEIDTPDGMGGVITTEVNGAKPDLNPSLGIATNPVAPLSVVIFATLQVVDFDFTNKLTVPATARIQFSPNQKFDIGAEFTFLNLKPAEDSMKEFYDDRFLTLFIASRLGK